MFCLKCGNQVDGNIDFCPNCGNKIENQMIQPSTQLISETLSEKLSKNNPIKPFMQSMKNIVMKYKNQFIIGISCLVVLIAGVFLFNKFYDFTKIKWQKDGTDYNIKYTEATILNLEIIAFDKEKNPITDIKFETKNGNIEVDGTKVLWTLPKEEGKYIISAIAPSGKKVKKEVNVVNTNEDDLGGFYADKNYDSKTTDSNSDGIVDSEAIKLGLKPFVLDSDGDGLPDVYEINTSKTDPLKFSTSGDGMSDGDKLSLGLDPLKTDSFSDGIKDVNRVLTYTVDGSNIQLEITGKGNIASTTIDINENSSFSNLDGLLSSVYNFHTKGTLQKAIVKIKYDVAEISKLGLNEDNLVLYYFDPKTKHLEPMKTTVDKQNKMLVVELNHFSTYVIGDSNIVVKDYETHIMMVIDNSISMYTEQQVLNAGYESCTGCVGNDSTFKRITLSNQLIDMFTGNYKFGVGQFSGKYVNMLDITDDMTKVKEKIESIRNDLKNNVAGTNIISALENGISKFSATDKNGHYLILMTDGENTSGNLSSKKNSIITSANTKNVKICVIGLGTVDTNDLKEIAEKTGCGYYHASSSSALKEIYSKVGSAINYNYVDTNDDGTADGMIIADSGFIVTRDGFSFENYGDTLTEGGHCYGMAYFATLNYTKKLPSQLNDIDKLVFHIGAGFKAEAPGFNFNNTYFFNKNSNPTYANLYDYNIKDERLNYYLGETPADYRDKMENDTWWINKKYYDVFDEIGMIFRMKEYKGTEYDIKQYQSALLNIEDPKFKNVVPNDDYQLLRAINRLFVTQYFDGTDYFSSNPDKTYNSLVNKLNNGEPPVIAMSGGGSHAINAIRLIVDLNDANKLKIEVYDNNYPGETRYIDVTRTKLNWNLFNTTSWGNEYQYDFSYYGVEKSVSIRMPSFE